MRHTRPHGFTLLEIAIAVTIGILLLSLATIAYSRFLAAARMDQITEEVVSVIREARDKTLARENGFAYGVHLEANQFVLFRAPAYTTGEPSNVSHATPNNFRLINISLAGGGADIVFQPISGETNMSGAFVVLHDGALAPSSTIRIYATGIVDIK